MEYIDLKFNEKSNEMFTQLEKGAFLTTKNGNKVNTMTIAWGGINFLWYRPVFVAYVRYTRDTYNMLKNNDEFTVSVPLEQDLHKELMYCGTKSGRDVDKIKDCGLTLIDGRNVDVPIIKDCNLHYECKVIYKQAMEPNSIPESILKRTYTNNDFHVIFYGEIVDSYIIKGR